MATNNWGYTAITFLVPLFGIPLLILLYRFIKKYVYTKSSKQYYQLVGIQTTPSLSNSGELRTSVNLDNQKLNAASFSRYNEKYFRYKNIKFFTPTGNSLSH